MSKSGYVAFDKALHGKGGLITTGNVVSDTMVGFHVRPRQETECNGFSFKKGELHAADKDRLGPPYAQLDRHIQRCLAQNHFETEAGWVYVIRHYEGKNLRIHGALVVDAKNKLLPGGYLEFQGRGASRKSSLAMEFSAAQLLAK